MSEKSLRISTSDKKLIKSLSIGKKVSLVVSGDVVELEMPRKRDFGPEGMEEMPGTIVVKLSSVKKGDGNRFSEMASRDMEDE